MSSLSHCAGAEDVYTGHSPKATVLRNLRMVMNNPLIISHGAQDGFVMKKYIGDEIKKRTQESKIHEQ